MRKLILFAAAAAVVSTSCMQEKPVVSDNNGQTAITIKIAGVNTNVRSEATPTANTDAAKKANLTSAWVYVFGSDGSIKANEALNIAQATAGGYEIAKGALFPADSDVYVLGNVTEALTGVNPATLTTYEAIKAAESAISYEASTIQNTDYSTPAMANSNGLQALTNIDETAGTAEAVVTISPLFARVEFAGIKGGDYVQKYEVSAVYLDDYFSSFTMSGAGKQIKNDGRAYTFNEKPGWFSDKYATTLKSETTSKVVAPAGGKVWAFNAGANTTLPTFVVEMKNIFLFGKSADAPTTTATLWAGKDSNGDATTPHYLRVTGAGAFERGKIYQISQATFNQEGPEEDIDTEEGVAIVAKVTVLDWDVVAIPPVLD
jgi:hypothetical protein